LSPVLAFLEDGIGGKGERARRSEAKRKMRKPMAMNKTRMGKYAPLGNMCRTCAVVPIINKYLYQLIYIQPTF